MLSQYLQEKCPLLYASTVMHKPLEVSLRILNVMNVYRGRLPPICFCQAGIYHREQEC